MWYDCVYNTNIDVKHSRHIVERRCKRIRPTPNIYARFKISKDLFLLNSHAKHFQSTNIFHISLEVLDLDFDNQTCVSINFNAKSRAMFVDVVVD